MTRYNHALTVAYEVESDNPEMPTLKEAWNALQKRMVQLEADPRERREALMVEIPFDTYEVEAVPKSPEDQE